MLATPSVIDVPATQKSLERLAGELDRNADAIAANRLRNLSAAVGGDATAFPEDWAAVDIQKVINPDAIVEGIKGRAVPQKWVRWFELARNSLVLVPLILTWLGIWQATSAYDTLLKTHNNLNGVPFLYLWQQGFNGNLFSAFILSNLALADFSFLALILILTLVVSWQYNLINTQAEKEAELLRERLAHTLGDATLCLAMARRIQRENQPKDLTEVARYLFQFGKDFQQTTQQFLTEMAEERKQRGDLKAFTASLEKITKDLVAATDSMNKVNTELTTSVRSVLVAVKDVPQLVVAAGQAVGQLNIMVNSLGVLVGDQKKWRQELQDVLAAGLNQLIANQKTATQDLHHMLDTSQRQMQELVGQQITEQRNAGQELRMQLNGLLNQLINNQQQQVQALQAMLVTKLDEIATQIHTSLGSLVAQQQNMAQSLLDAANTLEDTANDLRLAVKDVEAATKEQTKVLGAVQMQQNAQTQLTNQMTAATAEIKNVLRETRETGPELRSMSVDMANFVAALRTIPNMLKAEMFEPIKYYSGAAANIANGSRTLDSAANHLEAVVTKLDGRLGP